MVQAIVLQCPGLTSVFQTTVQDALQLLLQRWLFYRYDRLDTGDEISRHPVGAANEIAGLAVVDKGVNAVVLEKAANYAYYFDVVADSGNTRLDTAVAAHDQTDRHTRLTGAI